MTLRSLQSALTTQVAGRLNYITWISHQGQTGKPVGLRLDSPGLQIIRQAIAAGILDHVKLVEGPDSAHLFFEEPW